MKIVLIGAGSRSFGRGQIVDVLQCEELQGRDVTLALVDENQEALEVMTRVAERIKEYCGSDIKIEAHQNRTKALPGAKYVIISVARKRYELWEQDFRVPVEHGVRHVYGENGGPGALFHALRSFGLVIPICQDVEKLCPDAFVMNFTNPEARVLNAICHLTKVKAAGFCHGIQGTVDRIEKYLGKSQEDLRVISAGMNHLFCVMSVVDKNTGEEYLPKLLKMAAEDEGPKNSLYRKFAEVFGVLTYPSDDHIGEYVAWGTANKVAGWKHGKESHRVGENEDKKRALLSKYADGELPADHPEVLNGSGELTVPVICDMEYDKRGFREAVNVLNTEGYISNLPRDIVVEVPAEVDAQGLHPLKVGDVPEAYAALLRPQFAIHKLLTEAYRTRSKKLLLQALLIDPCINSVSEAEKILDKMLDLQSDYLPSFE